VYHRENRQQSVRLCSVHYTRLGVFWGKEDHVLFSHWSAVDLFQHNVPTMFSPEDLPEIKDVELLIGGDHGKGAFPFLMVAVIGYNDTARSSKILEFQIGKIDSTDDLMDYFRILLVDMEPGIWKMKPVNG
jgi:hypothetical protein